MKEQTIDGDSKKFKNEIVVQFSRINRFLAVGVTNAEGPPVPIPNTEVKLCSGDNTSREAAREDSSMPTSSDRGSEKASSVDEEQEIKAKPNIMGV